MKAAGQWTLSIQKDCRTRRKAALPADHRTTYRIVLLPDTLHQGVKDHQVLPLTRRLQSKERLAQIQAPVRRSRPLRLRQQPRQPSTDRMVVYVASASWWSLRKLTLRFSLQTTTIERPRDAAELPTGLEPPAQIESASTPTSTSGLSVEEGRQKSETPGRRIIPTRDPVSPSSPADPTYQIPSIPERSTRRSLESSFDQRLNLPSQAQPSQYGSQNSSYLGRNSTPQDSVIGELHASPGREYRKSSTVDNLKSAAAGVHVSQSLNFLIPGLLNMAVCRVRAISFAERSIPQSIGASMDPKVQRCRKIRVSSIAAATRHRIISFIIQVVRRRCSK